jgi:hypothetical protein
VIFIKTSTKTHGFNQALIDMIAFSVSDFVTPSKDDLKKLQDDYKIHERSDAKFDDQLLRAHWLTDTWIRDCDRINCSKCDVSFNVINRRKHCRFCGEIFCSNCMSNSLTTLPDFGYMTPVKVCKSCYERNAYEVDVYLKK